MTERSAELSEDTDCDGSSLPDDSPEVQIKSFKLHKLLKYDLTLCLFEHVLIMILLKQSSRKVEWHEESVDDPRSEK